MAELFALPNAMLLIPENVDQVVGQNFRAIQNKLNALVDEMNASQTQLAAKGADEIVNNSTTLQNDDDLFIALGANETWKFFAFLLYENNSSGGADDLKVGWTVPSGATIRWMPQGLNATNTFYSDHDAYSGGTAAFGTSTIERIALMHGFVFTSTTAGNLQLQWAQGVASATDLRVQRGSFLEAKRITS